MLEFLKIAILAGLTIALVRYYLFKPFYVKGASMEPNFYDQEYLIIDELSYRLHEPMRGDVIVFKYPDDPKEYFLKRIIGLPGERVKVTGGQVLIYNDAHPEGEQVQEDYLSENLLTDGERLVTLGPDQFFVLGDNRPNSYDSRRFGPVDRGLIVGRAWFRGWPFTRVQFLKSPQFDF
ncbi:MAG: signal peptidase I [Candidatus Magasanikbacteria bacterium RIFOXYD2_FULL_41_14]|uniref:Signal peptidase I n=1 Tax=Candidatus Magasanikbacteria bacterium RIFOXYD2_FULL_41_14 TaxID=1798709 RepID=A0A1F6PCI2_9BACT|nr:MAG: signal peptidase I [Candidatus Magasanikbacteria bacterium RIFOXYD2_FULL_41_14]